MLKGGVPLKRADDLFETSSMSFGAHLEELRKCLIWAVGFLFVGMCVGLLFANSVVNYVQTPLEKALIEFYSKRAERLIEARGGGILTKDIKDFLIANSFTAELVYMQPGDPLETIIPADQIANPKVEGVVPEDVQADGSVQTNTLPEAEMLDDEDRLTKIDSDIGERSLPNADKLDASAAVRQLMSQQFIAPALNKIKPFWRFQKMPANTDALGLQEPFMIWLKAGFVVGAVLASPGVFYSIWNFVSAGLYPHERKYVYFFLPFAILLFVSGASLAFFVIFELVINFLLTFNESLGIGATPRLNDYMSFALFLPLGFGIAFQLPLVMFVLERIGIISVNTYVSQWRTAILIITFMSMLLTPAEVTSMIGMAVPLVGLYFMGIALCKYFPRRGFEPEKGYDPV